MITSKDVIIGRHVVFTRCYIRKCIYRFPDSWRATQKEPTPMVTKTTSGYVVGLRSVIMSDARFHYTDGNYMTGKRETVMLVCDNKYHEPFIVRFCDLVQE